MILSTHIPHLVLSESWIEKDGTGMMYEFFDETTGGHARCPVGDFRNPDDTGFVKKCLLKRDYAAQFAYFKKIGDNVRKIMSASTPDDIESARLNFIKSASQYIMGRNFTMVIATKDGPHVEVKGDFRLSNHTVNPSEWERNGHHDFGISVVFDNNRTMLRKFAGNKHSRVEIWEYCVSKGDDDKVVALYNRIFSGKPVTKMECDNIMGFEGDAVSDGDSSNINMEFNGTQEKPKAEEMVFTLDDVMPENRDGVVKDRKSGETYPTITKYDRTFAVDEKNECVYLVKSNKNISYSNKFQISFTESFIRQRIAGMVNEAVRSALHESASSLLYHYTNADNLIKLLSYNKFFPQGPETFLNTETGDTEYVDGPDMNFMSFTRNKNFHEGYPVLAYGEYGSNGYDGIVARLAIDGRALNTYNNFKVPNEKNGKRHNLKVKPMDWEYYDYGNGKGDPMAFADNTHGIFAHNGKEEMMQTNGTTSFGWDGFGTVYDDRYTHPMSQAEDRLTTKAQYIPDANKYIKQIDLYADHSMSEFPDDMESTINTISQKASVLGIPVFLYPDVRSFSLQRNGRKI